MKVVNKIPVWMIGGALALSAPVVAQDDGCEENACKTEEVCDDGETHDDAGGEKRTFSQNKMEVLMPMLQVFSKKHRKEEWKDVYYDSPVLAKVLVEVTWGENLDAKFEPHNQHFGEGWKVSQDVRDALRKVYGGFENKGLKVKTGKAYSGKNDASISGAVAIALGLSLEDKKMLPGLTVAARLKGANGFSRPKAFWGQLKGLRKSSKPHRVLTAKGAERDFKQLIALRELEFFVLNEVIVVENLKDAVNASYTGGDKDLLKASKLFATIQKASQRGKLSSLVFNKSFKARLAEILRIYPNHLSAKMLLVAGQPKAGRPVEVEDEFAIQEITPLLELLEEAIGHGDAYEADAELLSEASEQLKERADEARFYLTPRMKNHCRLLAGDACLYLSNWARSRRQPESEYHKKNSASKKDKLVELVASIRKDFKRGDAKQKPAKDVVKDEPSDDFNDEDN